MEATEQQLNVSAVIHTEQIPLDNTAGTTPTKEETTVLPPSEDILDILEENWVYNRICHGSLLILCFHFSSSVRPVNAMSNVCAMYYPWDKRDTIWNESKDNSR